MITEFIHLVWAYLFRISAFMTALSIWALIILTAGSISMVLYCGMKWLMKIVTRKQ